MHSGVRRELNGQKLSAAVCVGVKCSAIEVLQGGPEQAGLMLQFSNYYTNGSVYD